MLHILAHPLLFWKARILMLAAVSFYSNLAKCLFLSILWNVFILTFQSILLGVETKPVGGSFMAPVSFCLYKSVI